MMPGAKGLKPHELAHKWLKDLGQDCGSAGKKLKCQNEICGSVLCV